MTQFATDLYQSPSTLAFFATVHEHAATMIMISFVGLFMGYFISGLDDLFIDTIAWLKRLRPKKLTKDDLEDLQKQPEKMFAVIIPAWDEGEIIARMIMGNLARIEYQNVHFFVGCYPNDPATVQAVKELERCHSRVHSVVNFKDGPTSKGQILNWVIDAIFDFEKCFGFKFDAFLMHDSEDLIHPKSLKIMNASLDQTDFIQIPVFSLTRSALAMVTGVYMDEFAESHTKDMLVRKYLKGAIPSAGVGTCMSRKFVVEHRSRNEGALFNDRCLTEDYELGVSAGIEGAKQDFIAKYYIDDSTGRREFIATREYFPKSFRRSVRQKTRWTLGIALQSWRSLGWSGTISQRYFLFRDRKGLITNPLMFCGYLWAVVFSSFSLAQSDNLNISFGERALFMGAVTGTFAVNRVFQRMICVARIYGWRAVVLMPLRLPIGNFINAFAVMNAVSKDLYARMTRGTLAWVKTSHELPESFGMTSVLHLPNENRPMVAEGGK